MHIRQAALDDTYTISALFRSRIERWQQVNAQGQVEDLPYEDLSIYARWLHGGAWMSVETGAIWLSHLLRGAGLPFVAEEGGTITGYVEVYPGDEPEPFGKHWHLAELVVHPDYRQDGIADLLMNHLLERAKAAGKLLASTTGHDEERINFYQKHRFSRLTRVQQYMLPARTGQSFYKAIDHPDPDPRPIRGWHMSIGRSSSARQQWEQLWPDLWAAIPQLREQQTHRLQFNASGQDAFLYCRQQLFAPRSAEIYCWSPKPLTSQLLVALQDWAHRASYRTLVMILTEEAARLLGTDAEKSPVYYEIYAATP